MKSNKYLLVNKHNINKIKFPYNIIIDFIILKKSFKYK